MLQHIRKINFVTLLGAALLFSLPWTAIQCSGRDSATQSGAQAIYGGATIAEDMRFLTRDIAPDETALAHVIGFAYFIDFAALAIFAGAIISGLHLFRASGRPSDPGMLAAVALVCILLQVVVGFPVNRAIADHNAKAAVDEDAAVGRAITMSVKRTPWFYLELVMLAVPAGLFVYSWHLQRQKADAHSPADLPPAPVDPKRPPPEDGDPEL